jgi:hypothetical protein
LGLHELEAFADMGLDKMFRGLQRDIGRQPWADNPAEYDRLEAEDLQWQACQIALRAAQRQRQEEQRNAVQRERRAVRRRKRSCQRHRLPA